MERIGRIILGMGQNNTAFILEEGENGRVCRFNTLDTQGNLDKDDRSYPARLQRQLVKFSTDEGGAVVSVNTLAFREPLCVACSRGSESLTAKLCGCGNVTNSDYKHCEVCALELNECARCGVKL